MEIDEPLHGELEGGNKIQTYKVNPIPINQDEINHSLPITNYK